MNTNSIGYYLMPNPTDTAAQAPYLPKLVPNGVANLNDIAAKVAESLPVSEERAKLLIRENFTESLKMALLGYTVDMGALRMKARIPGSMPCEDTPFDPEANACVIELYADGELSDAFNGLVPVKLTAAQLANAIQVSNVMDVETQRFGEIHGTGEFMILGNGVTLDGDGESAKLLDRKTDEPIVTAEVVSVSKGQRATCKLVPGEGGIAKGPYVVEVTTFGLIGTSTPRVFRKPVTLVEDIPEPVVPRTVTLTGVVGDEGGEHERSGAIGYEVPAMFHGTNLDTIESITWNDEGGHSGTIGMNHSTVNADGTVLTVDADGLVAIFDYELEGPVTVTMKSHGGVPESEEQTVAVDAETYAPL